MASHQDNFVTALTSDVLAGATTSPLNSIPTVDAPFYIAWDATNKNGHYEVRSCTSKTATNVNHSALTYAHTTDEVVRMVVPAVELDGFSPVGTVSMFAGATAPTGHLLCDGSAVSRTTYSALFAVLSTTYGAGDGSTTFNIPNLKGRVVVGLDATQTEFDALGETGGEKTHLLTSAESGLPAHQHVNQSATVSNAAGRSWTSATSGSGVQLYDNVSSALSVAANAAANASSAHNNLQPYIALNYVIKY